jgi:ribosome assembly protein RRB1
MAPKRPSSPDGRSSSGNGKAAGAPSNRERSQNETDGRGEFEDVWEDEFEEEELESNDEEDDDDDVMEGVNGDRETGMEDSVDGMFQYFRNLA